MSVATVNMRWFVPYRKAVNLCGLMCWLLFSMKNVGLILGLRLKNVSNFHKCTICAELTTSFFAIVQQTYVDFSKHLIGLIHSGVRDSHVFFLRELYQILPVSFFYDHATNNKGYNIFFLVFSFSVSWYLPSATMPGRSSYSDSSEERPRNGNVSEKRKRGRSVSISSTSSSESDYSDHKVKKTKRPDSVSPNNRQNGRNKSPSQRERKQKNEKPRSRSLSRSRSRDRNRNRGTIKTYSPDRHSRRKSRSRSASRSPQSSRRHRKRSRSRSEEQRSHKKISSSGSDGRNYRSNGYGRSPKRESSRRDEERRGKINGSSYGSASHVNGEHDHDKR